MRRALRLCAAACAAGAGLAGRASAQTVTARVGGDLSGLPFTTVTVPITVDMTASGGARLGSYTARLTWDPAALTFCAGCSPDSLRGNFSTPAINSDSAAQGVLRLTAISPLGVDSLVTVARLPFATGLDTLSTAVQLSFSEMSAAGTFASLLPSLTVFGGAYCPARGRWGDVDGDGRSDSRDALMALTAVVGLPIDTTLIKPALADVDADGRVTSRDALIILSYAVGMDVPGQRVLLVAPGACGTGSAKQLAVFPGAAALVVGQSLRLVAQATDTAGRAVTATGVAWTSSDYGIAGVDTSGVVSPRAGGTVTITAQAGPGVRASATITVLARRPNWYVDVRATGSALQLGDAANPFGHPTQAFPLASEGDTIRVAPGTYLFVDEGIVPTGVILLGGTPGDTTTRPVFRDPSNTFTGLSLRGGARTLVRNVALQDFFYGVQLDGARSLALEDVEIRLVSGTNGEAIFNCGGPVDSVRVERSVFLGDSATRFGNGIDMGGCSRTGLVVVRDSKVRFWSTGVQLTEVDSTDVAGTEISDNGDNGLFASQENVVNPALHVARSRLERNTFQAIAGVSLRRLEMDSSVIRATQSAGIEVSGGCCGQPLMELALRGDSILMELNATDAPWIDVSNVDSAVVDRTVVRFPADTAFIVVGNFSADQGLITNSRFLNAGSGTVLYFNGRRFFADSLLMTGCAVAGCDQAYGLRVFTGGTGASARVQRSQFSQMLYSVYISASQGPESVQNVVADSSIAGIQVFGLDSAAITDNVLTRMVSQGIVLSTVSGTGNGLAIVARDSVACVPTGFTQQGIDVTNRQFLVRDNLVTTCNQAVSSFGMKTGSLLRHNTIRNSAYGFVTFQPDTVVAQIDSNAVSGADTDAVNVVGGAVAMTGNNIQNNAGVGLEIGFSGVVHQVHGNEFVGNGLFGIRSISDSVDATNNWWGSASGPGGGVADSVSGRVATSPFLTAAPAGLPPLAPPVLIASRALGSAAAVPTRTVASQPMARAVARPHPVGALSPSRSASPALVARLREIAARRAALVARADVERAQREREKETRQAEAEARRQLLLQRP